MPLGLLNLTTFLKSGKNHIKIYEPKFRLIYNENYKNTAADILKAKPNLIGFSTWCIAYPISLLIAKAIKSIDPKVPIIFGGPQASILANETLANFPFIDFVLKGEADLSFPLFIEELWKPNPNFASISGLVYRDLKGNILNNKLDRQTINLDNLPFPSYDVVPKSKIFKLDVGRGCPFKCTYCSTNDFFSKIYRVKSANRIVAEMTTAFEEMKITNFSFAHDMFTLNKKFILELCNKLINLKKENNIKFIWTCSARIDCVTNEMLIQMQKAGCQSIFFGIETGSKRIQKSIKKNLDVKRAYELADLCKKIDINMHASFILGFPEETKTDVEKTLQSVLKLAINGVLVQSSELTLLPGTPLYNKHKSKLKFDGKFSNFSHTICGQNELQLIIQYPEIFSSFYYLPVKTLNRQEILFLNHLINKISYFRNTLFLLSNNIDDDIKSANILQLFKDYFNIHNSENNKETPIVSHWIKIIKSYIKHNKAKINTPQLNDVFNYESYVALLKTLFASWQLVHQPAKKLKISDNFLIKPTPVWQILYTSYNLEKIVSSENKWKENKIGYQKGVYKYLLVAISETNCKKIQINEKEVLLLDNLSELYFSEFVKRVKSVLNKKETLLWIKKMRKIGVLETLKGPTK